MESDSSSSSYSDWEVCFCGNCNFGDTKNAKTEESALVTAARQGKVDVLKMLLDSGADVNFKTSGDKVALHFACEGINVEAVELLLEHGSAIDASTSEQMTPLHYAAQSDNERILELLLSRGADMEAKAENNQTPLALACLKGLENNVKILLDRGTKIDVRGEMGQTVLQSAIIGGNERVVKLLLDLGMDVNKKNDLDQSALWTAVYNGNVDVIQMLLDRGAIVREWRPMDQSPLHEVCRRGFEKVLKQFISRGADIFVRDIHKSTALHAAVSGVQVKIINELLDLGLDVNATDKDGKTALNLTLSLHHSHQSDLSKARFEIIHLLISRGANVNVTDKSGKTPLYLATSRNEEDIVKLLLEKGASIKYTYTDCDTVLHVAAKHANKAIVKLFLDHGVDVNVKNLRCKTPLHFAAERRDARITETLLSCGADIHVKSSCFEEPTALHVALKHDREFNVKLLLEKGAKVDIGPNLLLPAIKNRNRDIVSMLLNRGVDPEKRDVEGNTALIFAAFQQVYFFIEVGLGHLIDSHFVNRFDFYTNGIELLLDYGVNLNSRNNRGHSALYYVILNNISEKLDALKLLLNYGVDENVKLDNGKSILETFLSCSTNTSEVVIQHLVKMQSENLPMPEKNVDYIKSRKDFLLYQNLCEKEIEKMKTEIVGDSAASFYNVFVSNNPSQLAAYARNEEIAQVFKSKSYEDMFPIYASTLCYQFKKGSWRKMLQGKVWGFFHAVSYAEGNEDLPKLPAVCVDKIFSYLRNGDLRVLMSVCNLELNVEIFNFKI